MQFGKKQSFLCYDDGRDDDQVQRHDTEAEGGQTGESCGNEYFVKAGLERGHRQQESWDQQKTEENVRK